MHAVRKLLLAGSVALLMLTPAAVGAGSGPARRDRRRFQ